MACSMLNAYCKDRLGLNALAASGHAGDVFHAILFILMRTFAELQRKGPAAPPPPPLMCPDALQKERRQSMFNRYCLEAR
jgi:hypothetical protein